METLETLQQWAEYVNVNTGEYLGEGIFLSKEYIEKKQETQVNKVEGYSKKKKKDEFSKYMNSNFGSFYFNNYMKLLKKLNNNTALLFRFLYWCTYADYDGYLKYGNYIDSLSKFMEIIMNGELINVSNKLFDEFNYLFLGVM